MISHEARPSLTLIPPTSVDKRPMTFRFIEAVQRLVPNFTKEEWEKIYEKVGARLHLGQLQKVFVILSDEDRLTPNNRSGPIASGSNLAPLSSRGGRGGRGGGGGGRGGHQSSEGSRERLKRGFEGDPSATPAKNRRGK